MNYYPTVPDRKRGHAAVKDNWSPTKPSHWTKALAFCLATLSTHGQTITPATEGSEQKPAAVVALEKFTVTGSHIAMSTAEVDKGGIPIELMTRERFNMTAGESISDFIRQSPISNGYTITNANAERDNNLGNIGGANSHSFQEAFNLRGFGPQYTLVLVNGRRFGGEGMVPDVSIIPSEAVESVEMLKSGASATYGTDALTGVVNMKLRSRFEGVEIGASYGNTTDKDAGVQRYSMIFGTSQGKFRFVGTASYQDHNSIMKWDRSITASRDFTPLGGSDNRSGNLAYPQRVYMGTNVSGTGVTIDGLRFQPGAPGTNSSDYVPVSLASQRVSTNEPETLPAYKSFGASWNAEYDILDSNRMTVFSTGFYQKRDVHFRYLIAGIAQATVAADNPFNPFGQLVTVRYFFGPNEVLDRVPHLIAHKTALMNTFGVKGELKDWNYEVAYTRYAQDLRENDQNQADLDKVQAAVNAGTLNLFGYWVNSPAVAQSVLMNPRSRTTAQTLDMLSANVNGKLFTLPAGDLRAAVGAEYRKASFETTNDAGWRTQRSIWYVDGPNANLTNSLRKRSVEGYYGELNIPLWRPANSVVNSVDADVTYRYETLGSTGSTSVPSGWIRAAMFDDSLILRTSYSESFRSPSLQALTRPVTDTIATAQTVFDPVRGAALPYRVIEGGNPDLKPETGKNTNFGVVYTPKQLPQLTVKADYWDLSLTNLIGTGGIAGLYNGTSALGTITRDANQFPTFDIRFENGKGVAIARGVDVGASYRLETEMFGKLTFDVNATNIGKISPQFGVRSRTKVVGGVHMDKDKWDASLFIRMKSGWNETISGRIHKIEDYYTGDIQVGYSFSKDDARLGGALRNMRVYLGVENFWDESVAFVNNDSADGWDRESDYRGRYVYAGFRKKL